MKTATTRKRPRKTDPDIAGAGADAAMRRAARRAHERAARFGHTIAIFEDGVLKEIEPIIGAAKKPKAKPATTTNSARRRSTVK